MDQRSQIAGAALFLLSAYIGYEAFKLRYYTPIGPGPGFFVVWLAGALTLLSIVVFVSATLAKPTRLPEDFWPADDGALKIVVALAGLLWMALTLEPLGYIISSFVFLLALIYVIGLRSPAGVIGMSVGGSVGIYALFQKVLDTYLPPGLLSF